MTALHQTLNGAPTREHFEGARSSGSQVATAGAGASTKIAPGLSEIRPTKTPESTDDLSVTAVPPNILGTARLPSAITGTPARPRHGTCDQKLTRLHGSTVARDGGATSLTRSRAANNNIAICGMGVSLPLLVLSTVATVTGYAVEGPL